MEELKRLLANPSVESWKAIVKIGRGYAKYPHAWPQFAEIVLAGVESWPKELERRWPENLGPSDFRALVSWIIREVDTYGHYCHKVCGDPRLQLDGRQRVWLERRFTGGVVPASVAKQVIGVLLEATQKKNWSLLREAISVLSGSIRNTGKVGTADLTGGLILRRARDATSLAQESLFGASELSQHLSTQQAQKKCQRNTLEVRLEVEIKVGDGAQRPEQIARQQSVVNRGGCYVLCRSVEEAVQKILLFIAENE